MRRIFFWKPIAHWLPIDGCRTLSIPVVRWTAAQDFQIQNPTRKTKQLLIRKVAKSNSTNTNLFHIVWVFLTCIALVTLSALRHFSTRSFWNVSSLAFHGSGKGSLWRKRFIAQRGSSNMKQVAVSNVLKPVVLRPDSPDSKLFTNQDCPNEKRSQVLILTYLHTQPKFTWRRQKWSPTSLLLPEWEGKPNSPRVRTLYLLHIASLILKRNQLGLLKRPLSIFLKEKQRIPRKCQSNELPIQLQKWKSTDDYRLCFKLFLSSFNIILAIYIFLFSTTLIDREAYVTSSSLTDVDLRYQTSVDILQCDS